MIYMYIYNMPASSALRDLPSLLLPIPFQTALPRSHGDYQEPISPTALSGIVSQRRRRTGRVHDTLMTLRSMGGSLDEGEQETGWCCESFLALLGVLDLVLLLRHCLTLAFLQCLCL